MREYPQMSEADILEKDWDWVDFHSERLLSRIREERRWGMMSLLLSVAAGFGGGEALAEWNRVYSSLLSEEESGAEDQQIEAQLRLEHREREERLRREAQERKERDEGGNPPPRPQPRLMHG